jgi:hypothetical protein
LQEALCTHHPACFSFILVIRLKTKYTEETVIEWHILSSRQRKRTEVEMSYQMTIARERSSLILLGMHNLDTIEHYEILILPVG